MKKLGITKKELFIDYLPTILTGIVMIVFAIIKEQTFFKTLPTLISLVVMLMSARANRFSFLLGASNCVLYAISYFDQKIYFSAANAFFVSLPIQICSFFLWQKHKTSKTRSRLVRMKAWQIALAVVAVLVAWAGCYFGLARFLTAIPPSLILFFSCLVFLYRFLWRSDLLRDSILISYPAWSVLECGASFA